MRPRWYGLVSAQKKHMTYIQKPIRADVALAAAAAAGGPRVAPDSGWAECIMQHNIMETITNQINPTHKAETRHTMQRIHNLTPNINGGMGLGMSLLFSTSQAVMAMPLPTPEANKKRRPQFDLPVSNSLPTHVSAQHQTKHIKTCVLWLSNDTTAPMRHMTNEHLHEPNNLT